MISASCVGSLEDSKNRCTGFFDTEVSRARYYQPGSGRFWAADSLEGRQRDPQTLHRYAYCKGNPVDGVDRSGNEMIEEAFEWLSPGYGVLAEVATERAPARTFSLSAQGLQLISTFENFSAQIYQDAAGNDTIGFGHKLLPGEQTTYANGVTREQGLQLLRADTGAAESIVGAAVTAPINKFENDALVSFTFNEGGGHFRSSTLLQLLNQSNYDGAAAEFGRWTSAGGHQLRGLVERRRKERILFSGETWLFSSELGFDPY
jgi:lysozyme